MFANIAWRWLACICKFHAARRCCASGLRAGLTRIGLGMFIRSRVRRIFIRLLFWRNISTRLRLILPLSSDAGRSRCANGLSEVSGNPRFIYAKLWKKFTHEHDASLADEREARAGLTFLQAGRRLGALLLQFPFRFTVSAKLLSIFHDC